MCGEHSDAALMIAPRSGSSPHVRGAHGEALVRDFEVGIIPACAGSTSMSAAYLSLSRDHPRMCGEHAMLIRSRASKSGSSPHVRGALTVGHATGREHGIIPACAGSTKCVMAIFVSERDHPRMCGEHLRADFGELAVEGSSPHVRGARGFHEIIDHDAGIIPACAGSTSTPSAVPPHRRDHPRMCGEHPVQKRMALANGGSSPHVRGAPSLITNTTPT